MHLALTRFARFRCLSVLWSCQENMLLNAPQDQSLNEYVNMGVFVCGNLLFRIPRAILKSTQLSTLSQNQKSGSMLRVLVHFPCCHAGGAPAPGVVHLPCGNTGDTSRRCISKVTPCSGSWCTSCVATREMQHMWCTPVLLVIITNYL